MGTNDHSKDKVSDARAKRVTKSLLLLPDSMRQRGQHLIAVKISYRVYDALAMISMKDDDGFKVAFTTAGDLLTALDHAVQDAIAGEAPWKDDKYMNKKYES